MAKKLTLAEQKKLKAEEDKKKLKNPNLKKSIKDTSIGKPTKFNAGIQKGTSFTSLGEIGSGSIFATIQNPSNKRIIKNGQELNPLSQPVFDNIKSGQQFFDGMQNSSVRKNVGSNKKIPGTNYQSLGTINDMIVTNNFANPSFSNVNANKMKQHGGFDGNVQSISPVSARTGGLGAGALSKITGPVFSQRVSTKAQSARSRGAASTLANLGALSRSGLPAFANPVAFAPGVTATAKGKGAQLQKQFSVNTKLISAGFGVNDVSARASISAAGAASSARIKKASRARNIAQTAFNNSPQSGIAEANAILAEQGANYRIKSHTVRRRRGRWSTNIVKYYIGPSTRTSYSRTIHNGRRVTAYRGMSPGQLMGGANPIAIINAARKNSAIFDFAVNNTDIQPTGKYYNTALNASAINSRIASLESTARRVQTFRARNIRVPQKPKWRGNGLGYSSNYRNVMYTPPSITGSGPVSAAGGKLTQAQANEYNDLMGKRGKTGSLGKAAFAAHVMRVANQKKKVIDKFVDPLDSIYSYATISDDQVKEFQTYSGELKTNIGEFDTNIDLLKQGIAKVQVARGKATAARKTTSFLPTYGKIEEREKPFDTTIANTSKSLADINTKISGVNTTISKRNSLQLNINNILGTSSAYTLSEATSRIGDKITAQKAAVTAAEANVAAKNTPAALRAARYALQRMSRGRKRRYRSPSSIASAALRSQKAQLSKLQAAQAQITRDGKETFGDDKINSGVIATSGNRTMRGNRTGKRNWYRGATGYTTLHVPKNKIPASGKVIVEATISYSSGYKGPTHADTTFGRIQGSRTVKKELPVDANGNIQIYAKMYGTKYGQQAVSTISGIKIIDPTSTRRGAELYGQVNALTDTKTNLTSVLQDNQGTKSYFDSAQLFLTGKSNTLKDKTGKSIATYSGSNLQVQDQAGFKDLFGDVGADVFGATRSAYAPITKLNTQKRTLQAQKQQILTKEASRGAVLTTAKKTSLTSQANALKAQATKVAAPASRMFAQAANDEWPRHSQRVRNNAARTKRAAQSLVAQASSLRAQAKDLETYRDTGVDPRQIATSAANSKVSALDTQLGTITATTNFFSGGVQELKIGDKLIATRGQAGRIDVMDDSVFKNLGISVPLSLQKEKKIVTATKFAALEGTALEREATQKALITELKTIQKARVKENAAAQVAQVNKLVASRTIGRREAQKMKTQIAKETTNQTNQIVNVPNGVPLPDITEFDSDLRGEAQKILDSTGAVIKGAKLNKAKQRLRQVTRSRKPSSSVVGAVLKVGATVPRPRPVRKNNNNTSLQSQNTSLRNPFIA